MESLIVKKDGLLERKDWVYDEEKKKGDYEFTLLHPVLFLLERKNYILTLLNEVIELEDGFTVRDWFKLVKNYQVLQLLDGFFPDYLEEFESCPESNCLDPDKKVHTICLQKLISFDNYGEDSNYSCNVYMDVYGEANDEAQHYGIDFWALKNYLDTPMKLLPGITFRETWNKTKGKNSKTEWGEKETVNIYYTLFDLIYSYIYEISFAGTPNQRDEKYNDLTETVKRIESGEEKCIPCNMDELFGEEENDS